MTPTTILNQDYAATMLAIWSNPENVPIKGELLDMGMVKEGKSPLSCMCAQGQILYVIGNYSIEDIEELMEETPEDADAIVSEILKTSSSFSRLIRRANDDCKLSGPPVALFTDLQSLLGPNCDVIQKFWVFIDDLIISPADCQTFDSLYGNHLDIYRRRLWDSLDIEICSNVWRCSPWHECSNDDLAIGQVHMYAALELAALGSDFSKENPPVYLPVFESLGFDFGGVK